MNNILLLSKENKDNKEIMELRKYQNKEGKNEMSMKMASSTPIFVEMQFTKPELDYRSERQADGRGLLVLPSRNITKWL